MAKSGKKLDLIQEVTTHKNDFKPWPLPKEELPSSRKFGELGDLKSTKIPRTRSRQHDQLQSMNNEPFDLFLQPKPIIGKNPRQLINLPESNHRKLNKDNFLYKLPGQQLTEVTDEEIIRNLLINTYASVRNSIYQEACLKIPNYPDRAQTVTINDKVSFRPELYPSLPPGWLDASKHWDCLQSRILGDPTRTFWLRKGPEVETFSKSDHKDIIPEETKREIRNLIQKDRLRLPFNVTKTGYGGYRQIAAKGVPLRRDEKFDFYSCKQEIS